MPSSRTATALRSMSGGPRSCWRQQTVSAHLPSCDGRARARPPFGAGRSASRQRASTAIFATRRARGIAPFGPEVGERIVALTLTEPLGETTHWTGRAMAKAAGVSLSYVQRIWRSHGLQPHRIRTFKLSNDPAFAAKVRDIVGLYVDPPAHAVVLSIDEKSQIQALDRTQPGLPMKRGRAGTMTHAYRRNGTI